MCTVLSVFFVLFSVWDLYPIKKLHGSPVCSRKKNFVECKKDLNSTAIHLDYLGPN